MSLKYRRFLLSTCLPVMAVAVFMPISANAGFEWNPPSPSAASPVIEMAEPAPAAPVNSEVLTDGVEEEIDLEIISELMPELEPAIEIKILNDTENNIDEIPVADIIIEVEVKSEIEVEPEILEESVKVEQDVVMPVEIIENPAVQDASSLIINPFPVEDTQIQEAVRDDATIILPSDSNIDIADLNDEDVNIEEKLTTEEVNAGIDAITWNTQENFDVIDGFGSEMPLALALRQIVPPQYAFSFGRDVNPGAAISWTGGNPWNEVLEVALSPLNISFDLIGKKLILRAAPIPVSVEEETKIIEPPAEITIAVDDVNSAEDILDAVIEAEILDGQEGLATNNAVEEIIEIEKLDIAHQQDTQISTPAEEIVNQVLQDAVKEDIATLDEIEEADIAETAPLDIIEIKEDEEIVIIEEIADTVDIATTDGDRTIKRQSILDPGQFETEQPEITENPKDNLLLDEKKNEVAVSDETSIATIIVPKEIEIEQVAILEDVEIASNHQIIKAVEPEFLDEVAPAADTKSNSAAPEISVRSKPSNIIKVWQASRGDNLKDILISWSADEHIKLVWNATDDYVLDKDIFISATFKNAVDILFSKGLKNAPDNNIIQDISYELQIDDRG